MVVVAEDLAHGEITRTVFSASEGKTAMSCGKYQKPYLVRTFHTKCKWVL